MFNLCIIQRKGWGDVTKMMTWVIDFTPLHKSNEQLLMDKTFIVKIQEHGGEDETPPVPQRPRRPY